MNSRLKPCFVIGYTTRKHLLIDLDDTTKEKAMRITKMIQKEWPEVGSCLLMLSSTGKDREWIKYDNYQRPWHKRDRQNIHLIFDNLIGYNKCCKICQVLAELRIVNKAYTDIRKFRGDMTLRVSPKVTGPGYKPYPEPLTLIGMKEENRTGAFIREYLSFLGHCRSLRLPVSYPEGETNDRANGGHNHTEKRAIDLLIEGDRL